MLNKIASNYLEKIAKDAKYPYYSLANDVALIESMNGKQREGDFINGVPHSTGLLHIRKVFPSERAKYEARRKGKPMTYYPVVDDVNDRGYNYTVADLADDNKQREIFSLWSQIYANNYKKKFKRPADRDIILRMWNGGPNGHANPKTLKYVEEINKRKANPQKWGMQYGVITPATPKNTTTTTAVTTNTRPPIEEPRIINSYTVQKGDAVDSILNRKGYNMKDIINLRKRVREINKLDSNYTIRPGQQLILPDR